MRNIDLSSNSVKFKFTKDLSDLKRQKEMERRKELKKINRHREQWNQTVISQNQKEMDLLYQYDNDSIEQNHI